MFSSLVLFLLQASTPVAIASCSADSRLPQDPIVSAQALIRRGGFDLQARVYLSKQGWGGLLGDITGDGWADAPPGIDAITWSPTSFNAPDISNFVFSCNTKFGIFNDGDLLRWTPGSGLVVEISEQQIKDILQPGGGSIDVDAIRKDQDGNYWLSFRSNLIGTVLGDIADGDVLQFDFSKNHVSLVWSESDIQQMVSVATGSLDVVGDLIALATLPGGEPCFVIQSPSARDASLFGSWGGGHPVLDWQEKDWDFQVQTEIDALCFCPSQLPQPPVLMTDLPWVATDSYLRLKVRFAQPGAIICGYRSLRAGFAGIHLCGVGFIGLNTADPWLLRQYRNGRSYPLIADGSGSGTFNWRTPSLPPGAPSVDMHFQIWGGNSGLSAPIVVKLM